MDRPTTPTTSDSAVSVKCPIWWCAEPAPHHPDDHSSDDRNVAATADTALDASTDGALFPSVVAHLRLTQVDPRDVCLLLTLYPALPHPQVSLRMPEVRQLAAMLTQFADDAEAGAR